MKLNAIRAWKDETYRLSLSQEQRCRLPENPIGELELSEPELAAVYAGGTGGGGSSEHEEKVASWICSITQCQTYSQINALVVINIFSTTNQTCINNVAH